MRAVLRGGRARGGCDLEALLAQLPLGGGASRAWSMRLGVQLLELAVTEFSGADTGHAPVAAWAAAAEASGAAARPELPTHAACWLPPSLLHLLRWLAQRTATDPLAAEAEAEERAAEPGERGHICLNGEACEFNFCVLRAPRKSRAARQDQAMRADANPILDELAGCGRYLGLMI